MTRVLHVLAPAPSGGLESVVRMLAAAQRDRGVDARVLAVVEPGRERHPFLESLEALGTPCGRLDVPHRAYWREYRGLRDAFRAGTPDVVHTHGYRADVLAGLAARRTRTPVVSTAHGFIGGDRLGRLYEGLQLRSYRDGRRVVAVSGPLLEKLEATGVPHRRLHLIRNAWRGDARPLSRVEARAALGLGTSGAFIVGWVGRLGLEKGPDVMLAAMDEAESSGMQLSMIGGGDLAWLERLYPDAFAETSRVRWHGRVGDAGRLMPAFDALALTSRTEGTPIVVLEGMAAGVPIVAAAVGGVPDILRDEEEGLLVPPGDPGAVARALARLRADPPLGSRLAEAADRRLRLEFGADRWVDRHATVYEMAARDAEGRRS